MTRALKNLSDEVYLSHDDPYIDFSSAGLYLVGLQTTVATVACAATSVACCWLMPIGMISAVRTLALTGLVAFVCMRKPIRIGRVRGVTTIFNALRPCVMLFIMSLVIEQLVHTCVPMDHRPSGMSRRIIFHCTVALMAAAGLWRASKPMLETDAPFLVTALCIVVIAALPPPAVPLSGPLCEAASLFGAGERLMRAFLFAALYVIHVYCSPPNRNSIHDLAVCIMRCAAAAVWVMGCHLYVIWIALIQAGIALWARFGSEPAGSTATYSSVDTRSDSGLSDAELGGLSSYGPASGEYRLERNSDGVLVAPYLRDPPGYGRNNGFTPDPDPTLNNVEVHPVVEAVPMAQGLHPKPPSPSVVNEGVPVDPRHLSSLVGHGGGAMTAERMAQIASKM